MSFGENIRKARKAAGMTQNELAERLHVYQKDVSRWEKDIYRPSIDVFARICKELKASSDVILELSPETPGSESMTRGVNKLSG